MTEAAPRYQWRYRAGARGHISVWHDVNERSGLRVPGGMNRITEVMFRVKPERDLCVMSLVASCAPEPPREHRCQRDAGHGGDHATVVDGQHLRWSTTEPERALSDEEIYP